MEYRSTRKGQEIDSGMQHTITIEICVNSLDLAVAAARGGDRDRECR